MMACQACLPTEAGGLGVDTGVVYLDTERKVCWSFPSYLYLSWRIFKWDCQGWGRVDSSP